MLGFLFFRIALAILGLLWFHINVWIVCSSSMKTVMGNLRGITLNLYIALGSMNIFTILIFPIQEHGLSFHFFTSSLISLIKGTLLHCWWECKLVQPLWRTVWRYLRNLYIELHMTPQSHSWASIRTKLYLKETCAPAYSLQHYSQ